MRSKIEAITRTPLLALCYAASRGFCVLYGSRDVLPAAIEFGGGVKTLGG